MAMSVIVKQKLGQTAKRLDEMLAVVTACLLEDLREINGVSPTPLKIMTMIPKMSDRSRISEHQGVKQSVAQNRFRARLTSPMRVDVITSPRGAVDPIGKRSMENTLVRGTSAVRQKSARKKLK